MLPKLPSTSNRKFWLSIFAAVNLALLFATLLILRSTQHTPLQQFLSAVHLPFRNADLVPHFLHTDVVSLSQNLFNSTPDPASGYSNAWTPLSLSECKFGMPRQYAPCVAEMLEGVVYAEELLYADFEIREPRFAQEEHRLRWRQVARTISERGVLQPSGFLSYKGQAGQNFVFANATYNGRYDSWSREACMAELVSTSSISSVPSLSSLSPPPQILPTVIIASSPDSYSFQHYLDRVTHIISQGAHLSLGRATYAFTGRKGSRFVQQLWERLGYDEEHVKHNPRAGVYAERLIFSCRAVLIHPWLSLRTLEAFALDRNSPSSKRNKVVYMSRSNGRAHNGGRKVVNEPELLEGIRESLAARNRGEELVIFDEETFANVGELFDWFVENVSAVIGPHGGALLHHRWAAKGTFVLEFMPTTFTSVAIYEEASALSQTYAAMIVEPTTPRGTDMEIEVGDVLALLKEHLGVEGEDPLRRSYPWRAKELGMDG